MTTIYKQQDNSLAEAIYTIVNLYCNMILLHHTNARGNSTSTEKKRKKKEISVISTAARILKLFVHVVFIAKLSDSQTASI